jgi:hypothetical protein
MSFDTHTQKLLNITQVMAFLFAHKQSLFLINKVFILAEKHGVIDIDNCQDHIGAFSTHVDPGI